MADITLQETAATPPIPNATYVKLFIDAADGHLKSIDELGTINDLTASGLQSVDLVAIADPTGITIDNTGGLNAVLGLPSAGNAGIIDEPTYTKAANAIDGVDLGVTSSPTNVTVTNDAGADAVLGLPSAGNAGIIDEPTYTKATNAIDGVDLGVTTSPTGITITNDQGADAVLGLPSAGNAGVIDEATYTKASNAIDSVDLGVTPSPTDITITNDAGTNAVLGLPSAGNAGVIDEPTYTKATNAIDGVDLGVITSPTGITITNDQGADAVLGLPSGGNAGVIDEQTYQQAQESQKIFDNTATEAEILAIDPSTVLGQTWWATDTVRAWFAITALDGSDQWQGITLQYDSATDSFFLPVTRDGQTQNIGQEVFFLSLNADSNATALNPSVFLSIGSVVGDEQFQTIVKAVASDLSEGQTFGINTTDINTGAKGKIATYGEIKDVNTSAWSLNDILYVDLATPGAITNVRPEINAFNVGHVLKVGATDGIIFVNTISSNRVDDATIPIGIDFVFLTGDTTTITAGTFLLLQTSNPGTVPSVTEIIPVPDNSTVASTQDHISEALVGGSTIRAGLRKGQIEYEVSNGGGNERIYFELYETNPGGTPIDSGIPSEPLGDLGVRPIMVLTTTLLDSDGNDVFKEEVRGLLENDYQIADGNRLRVHILCEKIGTAGGTKNFTLYFGSNHDSYLEAIASVQIEDVEGLPEALDDRVKWLFPWAQDTYPERTMTRIGTYTSISNKETSDYPVPQTIGEPAFLMDSAIFIDTGNVSVIESGHRYVFSKSGYVSQIRVQVPAVSPTITYNIFSIDNTNPANPIINVVRNPPLEANEWVTIASDLFLVVENNDIYLYIEAYDSATSTTITGSWTYEGTNQNGAPSAQSWNRRNQNNIIRIDKTDANSVDRTTDLLSIDAGSTIRFEDSGNASNYVTYSVVSNPVDQGSYIEYGTTLADTNGTLSPATTTVFTSELPIPSNTLYKNQGNFWQTNQPDFAAVTGFLEYDGVAQPGNDNTGFGIDIRFQEIEQSPDWDIVAISGGSGGGGGGGGDGVEEAPINGNKYVRQDAAWVTESVQAVDSVNGQTGAVVLDADDISDATTVNKYTNAADISKLAGIEAGAQVNTVDSVNTQTGAVVLDADDISDAATTNKFTTQADINKLSGIEAGAEVNTVDSVNAQTGTVVLDADDISDAATINKFTTQADINKLAGIEAGAQVNTVASVNAQTGTVVLDADDISDAATTNKFTSQTEINKLAGIEAGAQVNEVGEAPIDGTSYVRNNAGWVSESGGGGTMSGSQVQTVSYVSCPTANGLQTGRVNAVAIYITEDMLVNGIRCEASGSGSGNFSAGIYEHISGNNYNLLIGQQVSISGVSQDFVDVPFSGSIVLAEGKYMIGLLTPQTGGANPSLYNLSAPSSPTIHSFISQQDNLLTLPSTITVQQPLSNMYWVTFL